jgi:hypothetical protein
MNTKRILWAAAIALSAAPVSAPAFAQCVASDSLQLGSRAPVVICEGSPEGITGNTASDAIDFPSPILPPTPITQDLQITLTEPGSSAVSDYVNVDPIIFVGSPLVFGLDVTLVSDNETPLNVSPGTYVIAETGKPQNLDSYILQFYGWNFAIPSVDVTSDVSDVPEPSTWLMMLAGLAGLGIAGHRASRKATAAEL